MKLDRAKFATFILSHGRPDNVVTLKTLKRYGYTGKTYILIDDEDPTGDEYRRNYGDEMVIQFSKKAIEPKFDIGDTRDDRRAVVFARNACFEVARKLGLDYFLQLDDDYSSFAYRSIRDNVLQWVNVRSLDKINDVMLDLLEDTGALTVAMSQGGDHLGGAKGLVRKGMRRKAMNSFYVRTNRPINFIGRINEDVNAYVVYGALGELFLTPMVLCLVQTATQQQKGGLTEIYLSTGTYTKSFYTVMMAPSCVKIMAMGPKNRRLHHIVYWDRAVPKIIHESFRKEVNNA
jgi:hypothetical protein